MQDVLTKNTLADDLFLESVRNLALITSGSRPIARMSCTPEATTPTRATVTPKVFSPGWHDRTT
jgi:hypothetical protein